VPVLPLPAKPIDVLEFVQVKVAPVGVLTKVLAGIVVFAQPDTAGSGVITGAGLTVTVTTSVEEHPVLVVVVVTV
jgi:hypothetical protein